LSVSCTSPTACTAVGFYGTSGGVSRTLVESWNGTSWSRLSSPSTGTHDNVFYGVACNAPSSCKAVGYYLTSSNRKRTLIATSA
jgi:hypothetical protein